MYFRELGRNWTILLAASLGISLGSAMSYYTMSMFGPPMLAEYGWSKAQFALIGSLPLITLVLVPFAGRLTDRLGPRLAASIGFVVFPLGFVAYTLMSGDIIEFFAIYTVQQIFGILTTSFVFARVIVERFDSARGIALSIMMTGPPLSGAILPPILGGLIQEDGWRTAFLMLAALSAAGGLTAILLMGRGRQAPSKVKESNRMRPGELKALLRHPIFILVLAGMFLINLPQSFASTQLKLALLDLGAADNAATWMLSLYATGIIIGRFVSGLALDRIASHLVALIGLSLPAIGFLILAIGPSVLLVLAAGVMVIGLAQGAEGDIAAYLISRRFDLKNYSLILACITAMIAAGSAIGSLVMSFVLASIDSYVPFLILSAVATLIGAALFGLTGSARLRVEEPPSEPERTIVDQIVVGEIV